MASRLIHPRHRGADPRVLRIRAHRRRHRRPCRRLRRRRSSRCSTGSRRHCSAGATTTRSASRLRAQLAAASALAAPRAGPAHRVPHGRDQAALPRLGRSDRLLHATRPCRSDASCSTCTARAAPPGPPMMRSARRCRSSITCRIAARITAISIASTFRSMPSRQPARRRGSSGEQRASRGACLPASTSLRDAHRRPAAPSSEPFRPASTTRGSRWRSRSSRRLRERLVALLRRRDPLSERVHLGKAGVAGFGASRPIMGRNPPRRPRLRGRPQTAGCVSIGAGRALQTWPRPQRASGSSFYTAMRILPRAQREAMFEIYSFCRQVDDIADLERPARRAPRAARALARRYRRALRRQVVPAHARPGAWRCANSGSRREDFHAVIDGMEMDVRRGYPRARLTRRSTSIATGSRARSGGCRSACSEWRNRTAIALAHHLGRALQLTNILRDLDEDAAFGRLYLPREALRDAGITATDPATVLASPALGQVCARVVERAREHFARSRQDHGAQRAPHACARRASWRRPIASSSTAWSRAAGRIRAAAIHLPRSRLLWIILRHAFI